MVKPLFLCLPEPSVAKQSDVTLIGLIWMFLLPRSFKDHLCSLSVHKFFPGSFPCMLLDFGRFLQISLRLLQIDPWKTSFVLFIE